MGGYCHGIGVEIGALHRPVKLPPDTRAFFLDRLTEVDLRREYPDIASEEFAPVHLRGDAEALPLRDSSVSFLIASHLFEHLENPIAALKEFERVLKPHGILYLGIPDSRVTFDRTRQPTTVEHLLEEYATGPERNRWPHYLDWATHVDGRDEAHARNLLKRHYSIHFHVWTPETFLGFLAAARRAGGLRLRVRDHDAEGDELVVVLRKGLTLRDRWRMSMVRRLARDAYRAIAGGS